jgi:LysM repeat protein
MVSEDATRWRKRKVFSQKNGKFIAWAWAENDEEVNNSFDTSSWKFAKELEEQKVEVTLEEIAEKFGVNVEQIKIKK